MDAREIGNLMVQYTGGGRELQLLELVYAPDAVSVEGLNFGIGREFVGVDAIREKKLYIMKHFPLTKLSVHGPYLHGEDRFTIMYFANVMDGMSQQEEALSSVGLYHVSDGKVVREEFFM